MLTPMTESALPDLMRLERMPGYEAFVGRWERDVHLAEMASPDARYFTWRPDGAVEGFTILQHFRQPIVRLRRIAVAAPNSGTGAALLRSVMDWVFTNTDALGLDLQVRNDNLRAKAVYHREGFVLEGEGDDASHQRMIISRDAWSALPRRTS